MHARNHGTNGIRSFFGSIAFGLALLAAGAAAAAPVEVDPAIPHYEKVGGVSGNLDSIGSDTLNNLMTLWAEGFQKLYPSVRIQIEGKGSSTAPPALIAGTAQLGPMSREMKSTEVDEFEKKFGHRPTRIRVAVDALAVYVNKDNPLEHLVLPQVDAIFSKNRACGLARSATTWGDVGLTGDWAQKPISAYGRNSASGTYGFFKEVALCAGDYKDTVKEQPGSASVVQSVAEDRFGVGYSGIGYKTSGVKTVALSRAEGEPYGGTDPATVLGGKYPLARHLYVYINKPVDGAPAPLVREFLRYVLSQEGQGAVIKDGYLPISSKIVEAEIARLGGEPHAAVAVER